MREILSDQKLSIEQNFKITAGPGAGKTHWLTIHVLNVLKNSVRLGKTGKVACITFTNNAAEEIHKRLGDVVEKVEVSTIHSFLYKNILSPFGFLLKDNDGKNIINLKELEGPEENLPSYKDIYNWKLETQQNYLSDNKAISKCMENLEWKFNSNGTLVLSPRTSWLGKIGKYWIKQDSYLKYKEMFWKQGRIHYEDVLYFSYLIIKERLEIKDFISSKFPYIYIDEFQDTNPIQTEIFKEIVTKNTILGVIGDSAQSIYKFLGARRHDFVNFSAPALQQYIIKGNRRSTNQIVSLLNNIRNDGLNQEPLSYKKGENVKLVIGDKSLIIEYLRNIYEDITILARNNATISQIKHHMSGDSIDLIKLSRILDSNYPRQELLYSSIYSLELLKQGNYSEARTKIQRLFRQKMIGEELSNKQKRQLSISFLQELQNNEEIYSSLSIKDYLNSIFEFLKTNSKVKIGAKITSGDYNDEFAVKYTFTDLQLSINIHDDHSNIKTIHKAKGEEFENVLVIVEDRNDLDYILSGNIESEEDDARIYYVALSRAKKRLFVGVSEINDNNNSKAKELGFETINL